MSLDIKYFFFLHIPKTAGTMVSTILRSNFKKDFHQDHLFYADLYYEPWHIEDALRIVPYRCFSSHALRASSLPEPISGELIAFTFIRDPKDLAISCYFDLRNRVSGAQHPTQNMLIEEQTQKWKEAGFKQEYAYSVSQLNWLYPTAQDKVSQLKNDLAYKRLHLFPTHRFDEAMVCLEKLYPDHFTDCSYSGKKNTSKHDYSLDERSLAAVGTLPWIEEDGILLDKSNKYLDQLISEVFPTNKEKDQAMVDFKKRCHKKSIINSNRNLPKSITQKIIQRLIGSTLGKTK